MTTALRTAGVLLLTLAAAAPALAQPKDTPKVAPKDKPLPEPLPMGVPYYYQPGNPYWYAPVAPVVSPGAAFVPSYAPPGTYYTSYPATRPVVVLMPGGPVEICVPIAPVVVGPTWALSPVKSGCCWTGYPFGSSGPVYGRYPWDYTGIPSGGYGWYSTNMPHYPYSYQYPTIAGRVWMGYGW